MIPERIKTWAALVDGNKPQLTILAKLARKDRARLTRVVDIMHVAEYLWDASLAFHPEASKQREEWVREQFLGVLRGRASLVAAGMRRSAIDLMLATPRYEGSDHGHLRLCGEFAGRRIAQPDHGARAHRD